MTSLSDRALIVRVTSTGWTARRFDRSSSEQLTDNAEATRSAARVNQYLMAGADAELRAVNQCIREMRDYVEEQTVPWDTHGGRLVTPFTWFTMQPKILEITARFNALVAEFVARYPASVEEAKNHLGALYNPNFFPHPTAVASLFSLRVVPEALPLSSPSDPRFGMTQSELDALHAQIVSNVEARMEESLMSQWKRLRDEVARLNAAVATREGSKRTPLYETTLEKLRNTALVLQEMNVTDSPHINILCGEVIDALHGISIDTLRESDSQRANVHTMTSSVLKRIEGLLL